VNLAGIGLWYTYTTIQQSQPIDVSSLSVEDKNQLALQLFNDGGEYGIGEPEEKKKRK
jgi:hypothetical protein